ncbi:hypothetical protein QP028_02695 [Corynebacterium suedekumii]|nr:hypothetical protein QP028_02695 [Corynebacterium suedekumii]
MSNHGARRFSLSTPLPSPHRTSPHRKADPMTITLHPHRRPRRHHRRGCPFLRHPVR